MRRLLLERVLQIQEDERRRIARELHDEAGQLMTSLLVGLRAMNDVRKLADAKEHARRLREIASNAIGELSRLARGLHSTVLDDLGLNAALRRYADDFSQTNGIRVDLEFGEAQFSSLTTNEQLNLYRIVQEALTNVARHAQATRVTVRFHRSETELHITIRDNGRGFASNAAENPSQHLGIEGMRQRAAILGGTLNVFPDSLGGIIVELRLPLRNDSAQMQATG